MTIKTLMLAAFAALISPVVALAQSFPQDDDFVTHSPWESYVSVRGGEVRTDSEGSWSSLRVTYEDGVTFGLSFAYNDDSAEEIYRSVFDQELGGQVMLVIDDRDFPATTATMWGSNGEVGVGFNFASEAADCAVIEALSQARRIHVRLPDVGEGGVDEFTGRGSSAALTGLCV